MRKHNFIYSLFSLFLVPSIVLAQEETISWGEKLSYYIFQLGEILKGSFNSIIRLGDIVNGPLSSINITAGHVVVFIFFGLSLVALAYFPSPFTLGAVGVMILMIILGTVFQVF